MALGRPSYTITVMAGNPQQIEMAIGEATALFRNIRGVRVGQETNFETTNSDAVAQMLIESLTYLTIGAVVMAWITLIGASTGYLTIILDSVPERTREQGTSKGWK